VIRDLILLVLPPVLVVLGVADLVTWEKLSGVSGSVVLAFAAWAFLTDRIRPTSSIKADIETWKHLSREAMTDKDKTEERFEQTIAKFEKLVEVNEGLREQVAQSKHQLNQLTTAVKEKGGA
jgi:cell shape-determining protein MreC